MAKSSSPCDCEIRDVEGSNAIICENKNNPFHQLGGVTAKVSELVGKESKTPRGM